MLLGYPIGEIVLLALWILGAGILVGIFAGLFGIGGGAVIVPVLYEVFHVLNGGIATLEQAQAQLAYVDGVMMGRAAYQEPWRLLGVDPIVYGEPAPFASPNSSGSTPRSCQGS